MCVCVCVCKNRHINIDRSFYIKLLILLASFGLSSWNVHFKMEDV